jgi:hypothetical protein
MIQRNVKFVEVSEFTQFGECRDIREFLIVTTISRVKYDTD